MCHKVFTDAIGDKMNLNAQLNAQARIVHSETAIPVISRSGKCIFSETLTPTDYFLLQ